MFTFQKLWENHPNWLYVKGFMRKQAHPCDSKAEHHQNQCAIRMADCLEKSGWRMTSVIGKRCGVSGHEHLPHILRAKDLGNWLFANFSQMMTPEVYSKDTFEREAIANRKGIVWMTRFPPKASSVDDGVNNHIDLWNGTRITSGEYNSVSHYFKGQYVVFFPLA